MESVTAEEDVTSSTHFIPRRRPPAPPGTTNGRRTTSRPHSIGALIISNPKLVKGWQYYDNSPNQKDMQKYFSSINLGASAEDSFLTSPQQNETSSVGTGGTGKRSTGSGHSGPTASSAAAKRSSYPPPIPDDNEEANADLLLTGQEIKAVVSPPEKQDCLALKKLISPILGILLALIASTCLALSSVLIETLPPNQYPMCSVLLWTSQGLLWPSTLILLCPCQMKSINLTKPELPPWRSNSKPFIIFVLILRAVFGWTAGLLSILALNYISSENSLTIQWTAPVFVLLIAWILIKERPGWIPSISAILSISGVAIILQPSFLNPDFWEPLKNVLIGCSLAAAAMLLEKVFGVIILRHVRHVHFALITFIHGLVGTGAGVLLYFVYPDKFQLPVCKEDVGLALIVCLLVFLGHTGMFGALKHEQAGIFSVVQCWQVPTVLGFRYWFLNLETDDWLDWIGILLIGLAVGVLILRKQVYSRPKSRRTRKWLGSLLR